MKTRTAGLIGFCAIAMLVVGCAHTTTTAPRITYIPDGFKPEVVNVQPAQTAVKATNRAQRTAHSATIARSNSTIAGAALMAEGGKHALKNRPAAYRAKSFRNGKKGHPSLINMRRLVRMPNSEKLMGDKDNDSRLDSSPNRLLKGKALAFQQRTAKMLQPKKKPPMLNLPKIIKGGFFAKLAQGKKRGDPSMLSFRVLVRNIGLSRGMERGAVNKPDMREISRVHRSNAMSMRRNRAARQTREFRARQRVSHRRLNRRQHLGGRCFGANCRN